MENKNKQELKMFNGVYSVEMPKLVRAEFKPLTIGEIMQARLDGILSFDGMKYDSVSGIAYLEDKFKIIPHTQELEKINPNTILYDGGIKLTPEEYESIQAREFSKKDMILGQRLTQEQVLKHLGWNELVGDKILLEKYAEQIFKQAKDDNKSEWMPFHLTRNRAQNIIPSLRSFFLSSLYYMSCISDWNYLDNTVFSGTGIAASLVGVRENLER